MYKTAQFSSLIGKTITEVIGNVGDGELRFKCSDGTEYRQYHYQDCCESVYVEDIAGDLEDIIGHPIFFAEESSNREGSSDYDSCTWTFYKIDTEKGGVTIRWCGSSNGYYSESVDFEQVA